MSAIRNIVGSLAVGGIAVFAGTNAFEDKTERSDTGQIVESGGLGAFAIRHGDCVQLPDESFVASVEGVPCDQPHDAQVYAEFDVTGDVFPGGEALDTMAADGCTQRWEPALGPYDPASNLDLSFFTPTEESWNQGGDRNVDCFVITVDGTQIVGSKLIG